MMATDGLMDGAAAIELVKWDTPTDELLGIARVVRHLLDEHEACANDICIAAPNRVWANQVRRACESVGLDAVLCMPAKRLSSSAKAALAKLELLVAFNERSLDPGSADFEQAASDSGFSADDALRFASVYGSSRGFTLVHALGLEDVPETEVALLHVNGDEDAPSLRRIVAGQLSNPSVPNGSSAVAVRLMGSLDGKCERLFMVGCVDGLVPSAVHGQSEAAGAAAGVIDDADSFWRVVGFARRQAVVSGFSKVEADIAQRADIRSARSKVEHGKRMAMVSLTPFLLEAGSARPTTVGGQAYLRSHGLN